MNNINTRIWVRGYEVSHNFLNTVHFAGIYEEEKMEIKERLNYKIF